MARKQKLNGMPPVSKDWQAKVDEIEKQDQPATPEDPGFKVTSREESKSSGSVSIKLTEDGAADGSTRESTWNKLKTVLEKTPGLKERLLGRSSAVELISSKQVEPFYSGIGLLNTALAVYLLKWDKQVASAVIPYNADELKLLGEATADAVNENLDKIPQWLIDLLRGGGSVALGKLALVLFQVHSQKFTAVKQAMGGGQQPTVN
jgi:hypothetical protein